MRVPRGLRDYDPDTYERMELIRENFVKLARVYNVRLMEPSSIELLETLEAKGGEEIVNEIYAFKDKSGRDLGLRFDLTVGITRYVCERRDLPLPVKLGSFASMWRYDEPQRGRYRWFYQWDVEVYGDKSPEAYAEVLAFTYRMLAESGVNNPLIYISDRRTVEDAIRSIAKNKFSIDLMRALDKLGKKSKDEIISEYVERGFDENTVSSVLDISSADEDSDIVKGFIREDLLRLRDLLRDMGVPAEVSFRIVRGLDYYTDIVYEAYAAGQQDLGAVAGGGGYDVLPAVFGRPDLKALGVAGGVDRLLLASSKVPERPRVVYVVYTGELKGQALKVAETLRSSGVTAELARKSRLNEQLAEAERNGAEVAVLVLPRELSEGKLKIKIMRTREEKELPLSSLLQEVQNVLSP
ncbi:MAG: histidine--tRNA ligase [Nitrososphaeria archaeon]